VLTSRELSYDLQRAVHFAKRLAQVNGNPCAPSNTYGGRLRPNLGVEQEMELQRLLADPHCEAEWYDSGGSLSMDHLKVACYGCWPDAEGLRTWVESSYLCMDRSHLLCI
jgi:hypothetical protein